MELLFPRSCAWVRKAVSVYTGAVLLRTQQMLKLSL